MLFFSDINKTVEDLAKLFTIDIRQKRVALINEWLANSKEIDFDSTIKLFAEYEPEFDADVTANNMKRAAYLCSGEDIEWWRNYLLRKGLTEVPPESKNYAYRSRALTCLCMITDPTSILELSGSQKDELL